MRTTRRLSCSVLGDWGPPPPLDWGPPHLWREVSRRDVSHARSRLFKHYRLSTGTGSPVQQNSEEGEDLYKLKPCALRCPSGYTLGLRVAEAGVRDYLRRLEPHLQHIFASKKASVRWQLLSNYVRSVLAPLLLNTVVQSKGRNKSEKPVALACSDRHLQCLRFTRAIFAYTILLGDNSMHSPSRRLLPPEVRTLVCQYLLGDDSDTSLY